MSVFFVEINVIEEYLSFFRKIGIKNCLVACIVLDYQENIISTKHRKFHCLLYQALLSFAASYLPELFVFDIPNIDFSSSHYDLINESTVDDRVDYNLSIVLTHIYPAPVIY